jgi:hypothetical protein
MSIYCKRFKKIKMKTFITKSFEGMQTSGTFKALRTKSTSNKLFMYALELVLLYVLVFAAMSALAQEPAVANREPGKLEFVKESVVFNTGKVYLNWVAKGNSTDCIYVIERSTDGNEFEPVGLKEGIGSPLELLYSWVDVKPLSGTAHYRIKQIDNEGRLVAQADPKSVVSPETNPLYIDKSTRMVQVK